MMARTVAKSAIEAGSGTVVPVTTTVLPTCKGKGDSLTKTKLKSLCISAENPNSAGSQLNSTGFEPSAVKEASIDAV